MTAHYVYFIQAGTFGLVKIGFSRDPHTRLQRFPSEFPRQVAGLPLHIRTLVPVVSAELARSLEGAYHRQFAHLHRSGEWFALGAELAEEISAINGDHSPALGLADTPSTRMQCRLPDPFAWTPEGTGAAFRLVQGSYAVRVFKDGSWGLYASGLLISGGGRHHSPEARAGRVRYALAAHAMLTDEPVTKAAS